MFLLNQLYVLNWQRIEGYSVLFLCRGCGVLIDVFNSDLHASFIVAEKTSCIAKYQSVSEKYPGRVCAIPAHRRKTQRFEFRG